MRSQRFALPRLGLMLVFALLAGACTGSDSSDSAPGSSDATTAIEPTTTTTEPAVETTASAPSAQTRDVEIPTTDITLAGTLWLAEAGDPSPGVVLMHGSGPNSRHSPVSGQLALSFGFEIPIFTDIAEGLQELGFTVLSYDKRTCGPFNGCADNLYPLAAEDLVIDTFVSDAAAAVNVLRAQPETDPEEVWVIGHSQGAVFVPLLLADDPTLAGGVMIAGNHAPINATLRNQATRFTELLVQSGLTQEQAEAQTDAAGLTTLVLSVDAVADGADDVIGGTSAMFWRSWLDLHTRALAVAGSGSITQPVMVLNGEMDWNVPPTEAKAWAAAIKPSTDAEVDWVTLECVTHALNCISESDVTKINGSHIGTNVAPEVILAINKFISRQP